MLAERFLEPWFQSWLSVLLTIVSLHKLVSTDWTIDEAMTFIISGGAVAADTVHYTAPVSATQVTQNETVPPA